MSLSQCELQVNILVSFKPSTYEFRRQEINLSKHKIIFFRTCKVFSKFGILQFSVMFIFDVLGIFMFVTDILFTVVFK